MAGRSVALTAASSAVMSAVQMAAKSVAQTAASSAVMSAA
eukprot:CAMPEP_0173264928 /NCGR_PEP_ID=MMETSP1142-20121109/28256_1 /TAXON_ID=483371 /ORGANISM="non described non described, Strain CCMP2298" /LENGTH=39 /DNA_ID= /DNA_START= /DNA_END= /DNA_ORIENTATION=